MRTFITCLLALLFSSTAGASHAFAQNIKATLSGRVLDAQNSAIPNATLTLTETQRGQQRTLVSDAQGNFHQPGLEPGVYRVAVKATGFGAYESADISLRVGDAARFDIRLQVSQVSEVINIMTIRSADEPSTRRFCDVCSQDRHHHPGEKI